MGLKPTDWEIVTVSAGLWDLILPQGLISASAHGAPKHQLPNPFQVPSPVDFTFANATGEGTCRARDAQSIEVQRAPRVTQGYARILLEMTNPPRRNTTRLGRAVSSSEFYECRGVNASDNDLTLPVCFNVVVGPAYDTIIAMVCPMA